MQKCPYQLEKRLCVPIKYQDKRFLLNSVGKLFKRRWSLFADPKEVSSWNRREDERAYKEGTILLKLRVNLGKRWGLANVNFYPNRLALNKISRLQDKSFNWSINFVNYPTIYFVPNSKMKKDFDANQMVKTHNQLNVYG